jgi:hypothetical protein
MTFVSTGRLCHITSAGSGISPKHLPTESLQDVPVHAGDLRRWEFVLDMLAPAVDVSDIKTPAKLRL